MYATNITIINNVYNIDVTIAAGAVDEMFDITIKANQPDVTLPGFRAGKAPLELVYSHLKESVDEYVTNNITTDAIDKLSKSDDVDMLPGGHVVVNPNATIADLHKPVVCVRHEDFKFKIIADKRIDYSDELAAYDFNSDIVVDITDDDVQNVLAEYKLNHFEKHGVEFDMSPDSLMLTGFESLHSFITSCSNFAKESKIIEQKTDTLNTIVDFVCDRIDLPTTLYARTLEDYKRKNPNVSETIEDTLKSRCKYDHVLMWLKDKFDCRVTEAKLDEIGRTSPRLLAAIDKSPTAMFAALEFEEVRDKTIKYFIDAKTS